MANDNDDEVLRMYVDQAEKLKCRFYEAKYPAVEDVVMVNVRRIAEMGAYVTLLEYDGVEGMILLSELSRRRIRSINKLIRVNRNEVVMVLRVDEEKGYIDLSKRRVSEEDIAKCDERYNKAKAVHGVLRMVAEKRGMFLEDVYKQVGWPLYRKYGHAYDAFKLALTDQEDPFASLEEAIPEDMKQEILSIIRRRLAPQPIKVRSDIEMTCFTELGVEVIRDAMLAAEACSTEACPVKVRLVAPPRYVMTTMSLDKDMGKETLGVAIEKLNEVLGAQGGTVEVKVAPRAVSVREEQDLQAMMQRFAAENAELAGDDDDE